MALPPDIQAIIDAMDGGRQTTTPRPAPDKPAAPDPGKSPQPRLPQMLEDLYFRKTDPEAM